MSFVFQTTYFIVKTKDKQDINKIKSELELNSFDLIYAQCARFLHINCITMFTRNELLSSNAIKTS